MQCSLPGFQGNVAEVPYLRPKLMRSEYLTIFRLVDFNGIFTGCNFLLVQFTDLNTTDISARPCNNLLLPYRTTNWVGSL